MQVDDVIAELGEMIGISSLHTNKHGVVHLTVNNIGELFIDEQFANTEWHVISVCLSVDDGDGHFSIVFPGTRRQDVRKNH
jgi:hypothetical protein